MKRYVIILRRVLSIAGCRWKISLMNGPFDCSDRIDLFSVNDSISMVEYDVEVMFAPKHPLIYVRRVRVMKSEAKKYTVKYQFRNIS